MKTLFRTKNFWMMLAGDICLIALAFYFAHWLRFEGRIPEQYFSVFKKTILMVIFVKLAFFFMLNLYRGMWRYTSIVDMLSVVKAVVLATFSIVLIVYFYFDFYGFSVFVPDFILTLFFTGGARVGIRIYLSRRDPSFYLFFKQKKKDIKKLLLIVNNGVRS